MGTESVIKRGVPKITKPAPAVVAIKMVELLAAPDNQEESVADDSNGPTDAQKTNPNDGEQQQLEKQKQDEQLQLEKELIKQGKLKKEQEAKAKKEHERFVKLQKQEQQ